MNIPAIHAKHVEYSYPDGTKALDGISCAIMKGESVALIGSNGAGKSTLLSLLCGLAFPQNGTVNINGISLERRHLSSIRRHIGIVFQNPDDQLFSASVMEDVMFGPLNMDLPPEEARARSQQALETVGTANLANKAPQHLSGGEKRAVSIATVLSMSPDIILMDEPGTGLDPYARRNLINLLKNMPQTLLIATHDLDMALDACSKCLLMDKGTIKAFDTTKAILSNKALLESCRLEQPWRLMNRHS